MICPPKTVPPTLACCGSTYSSHLGRRRRARRGERARSRLGHVAVASHAGCGSPSQAVKRGARCAAARRVVATSFTRSCARRVERHALRRDAPVARDEHVDLVARRAPAQRGLDVRALDARAADGEQLVARVDARARQRRAARVTTATMRAPAVVAHAHAERARRRRRRAGVRSTASPTRASVRREVDLRSPSGSRRRRGRPAGRRRRARRWPASRPPARARPSRRTRSTGGARTASSVARPSVRARISRSSSAHTSSPLR